MLVAVAEVVLPENRDDGIPASTDVNVGSESLSPTVKSPRSTEEPFDLPALTEDSSSRQKGLPPQLRRGEVLADRFTILRFIARGGMGEVYEAQDQVLQAHMALKTIPAEFAVDPETLERLRREVLLARSASHPNVCRVYDLYSTRTPDGRPLSFLTMEFLDGETLARRLKRQGRMSTAEALPLVRQIAAGMDAAHAEGVVHRDLKPSNVMLVRRSAIVDSGDVRAVITDFGIARAMPGATVTAEQPTGSGVIGTPQYMAPEQVLGGAVGPPADIYALGLMLYEMVTGAPPFAGATPLEAACKRLKDPPAPPRSVVPDLDARWNAAILRCLDLKPAARFESAGELALALETPQRSRGARRWRGLALGVAALALLLGAFLFVRYGPSLRPKEPLRTAAQATPRPVVAILGVKNTLPSGQPAWLPTAIGELLAHELAAAETSLRVIPTKRVAEVRRSLGVSEDEVVDEKSRQRMEGLLAANVLVDGSLTLKEPGLDTVRVHLNVRDAQTGQARASLDEDIDAHGATLPAASIRLGARVRDALGVSLSTEQEAALAASRASSADAVQAYAQGVMSLRRFEKTEARGYFEAALTTDSSFLDAERLIVETWVSQGNRRKARDVAEHIRARPSGLTSRQAAAADVKVLALGADESKSTKARIALFDAMPDDLELGLRLADFTSDEPPPRTQLAIVGRLRQLPAPTSTDLRLDLAEAEAARALGEIGRANGLLTKMVDRAKKLGARTELGLAELERGEVRWINEARGTDALGNFVEAERLFAEVGELELLAYAKLRRAGLLTMLGPPSRALASLDEAISLSRRLGDRGLIQDLLLSSAGQLLWRGDLDGARRRVDEARLELQALGEPLTPDYFFELGNLEWHEANLQAVLAATRALQTHPLSKEALALPLEALVLREQDHVQQASESLRRAAMLWDQYGNQAVRDDLARGACSLECDEGRSADGLACLAEHPSPVGRVDDPNTSLEEAQCRHVAGDLTGAERAARNALSQAERGERFPARISSMVVLMHAAAARGQVAQAVSRLGAVLAEVESKHYKQLAFEVALALGEIELKAGRPEGRVRLLKLEQEAKSREFFRIARLAREALDGKAAQAH